MYKICRSYQGIDIGVQRLSDNAFIPFDPANIDYQLFKSSILSASAELQNANGELMTTEDATNFVKELP